MNASTRVLLVEDDTDLRASMADALETAGYAVDQAANGKEALAMLQGRPAPDVILLDLLMPVMNGWQFCEARAALASAAAIPVIAMSAAVSRDPTSPYYIDVEDYVAKPLDVDDLLAKVAAFSPAARAVR